MNSSLHLFISPHPDDAVWSCGGRIAKLIKEKKSAAVLTVFDGESPVPYQEAWRVIARPTLRRLENQAALKLLGALPRSLKLTDAALRLDTSGNFVYKNPDALFTMPLKKEAETIQLLTANLTYLTDTDCEINAPLAFGNHIDHRIVREAVRNLHHPNVLWYEDFPYPLQNMPGNMKPAWHQVDLNAWIASGLRYRSQVISFFETFDKFRQAITDYAAQRGKEKNLAYAQRTWHEIM